MEIKRNWVELELICTTRGGTKVMSPIIFWETVITVEMKSTYTMHTPFTKLRLCFIISTLFATFVWSTVCRSCTTLCWSFTALHTCCVLALCHLQNGILRVPPPGGQEGWRWRVQNRDCREDEREQSTSLLQLHPLCTDWCVVWCCQAGSLDSPSYIVPYFNNTQNIWLSYNCGILTSHAAQTYMNLYQTGAVHSKKFNCHSLLVPMFATSIILHCCWVEYTWLAGVSWFCWSWTVSLSGG